MDGEGRRGVWRLYGWFSGLMLCGSCFGAVAWGARMQQFVLDFIANFVPLIMVFFAPVNINEHSKVYFLKII